MKNEYNIDFRPDCHCHTLASGHGYSTIREYAYTASERNIKIIAITDHGPSMPGSCHIYHFENLGVIPSHIYGVRLLKGVEANILDAKGSLDLPDRILKQLDIVIASLHVEVGGIEENTRAMVNAMKNPFVKILGHPDDSRVPLNYEKIVECAKEEKVLIEVNNSSLSPRSHRTDTEKNYRIILDKCKKSNVSIIVNSDAHIHTDIGYFPYALSLLDDLSFPDELIVNTSAEKLEKWLSEV